MTDTEQETRISPLQGCPRHVAVIMDGNNRWARARGLRGVAGHRAGVSAVRAAVETCGKSGVEILTLFAFSSENWRRPEEEVGALMTLFLRALTREVRKLRENNIRLSFIGNRNRFSKTLQSHMNEAEASTAHCTDMELVIAADYGGQWDITQATRQIGADIESGRLRSDEITEERFQSYLSLGDRPMPDLLIRTGGEQRISNFLLWQFAYTEFYFAPDFWPDFRHQQMRAALEDFSRRQRRFGRTGEQVSEVQAPAEEESRTAIIDSRS